MQPKARPTDYTILMPVSAAEIAGNEKKVIDKAVTPSAASAGPLAAEMAYKKKMASDAAAKLSAELSAAAAAAQKSEDEAAAAKKAANSLASEQRRLKKMRATELAMAEENLMNESSFDANTIDVHQEDFSRRPLKVAVKHEELSVHDTTKHSHNGALINPSNAIIPSSQVKPFNASASIRSSYGFDDSVDKKLDQIVTVSMPLGKLQGIFSCSFSLFYFYVFTVLYKSFCCRI